MQLKLANQLETSISREATSQLCDGVGEGFLPPASCVYVGVPYTCVASRGAALQPLLGPPPQRRRQIPQIKGSVLQERPVSDAHGF